MEERTGVRDLTYNTWHRPSVISRYVGQSMAAKITAIDVDFCEWCCYCKRPLALIETQLTKSDIVIPPKAAPVTATLAHMAHIPAFSVTCVHDGVGGIENFAVRRIEPNHERIVEMTPEQYVRWLWSLRTDSGHDIPSHSNRVA